MIVKNIGVIPKELIMNHEKYNYLNSKIETIGIYNLLKNNIKTEISDETLEDASDFILNLLRINPNERMSIKKNYRNITFKLICNFLINLMCLK